MIEFASLPATLAGLGITYLIHSTLIVALAAWVARPRRSSPEVRVAIWKTALVAPLLTTAVTLLTGSYGFQFLIPLTAPQAEALLAEAEAQPSQPPIESFANESLMLRDLENGDSAGLAPEQLLPNGGATRSASEPGRSEQLPGIWTLLLSCFGVVSAWGLAHLLIQVRMLRVLRQSSSRLTDPTLLAEVARLSKLAGVRNVDLMHSARVDGPMVGGLRRAFIIAPTTFLASLDSDEREAMWAHELVHVARRDNAWKLFGQVIIRVLWIQPLNRLATRRLEIETEFAVDEQAALLLQHPHGLAGCLSRLGEWLAANRRPQPSPLAAGMASFRSTLGRRVSALLETPPKLRSRLDRRAATAAFLAASILLTSVAPSVAAKPDSTRHMANPEGSANVNSRLTTLALLFGLTASPVAADDKEAKKEKPQRPPITKKTADPLPDGIENFNGMIVGRVVKKDVERGTFILNIDAVPRVWRNSKAKRPKSIVGKNIQVDGVSGKWLDVLLVVKEGETLECEAKHNGGSRLTFPGELLRKVAPFDPKDYPELPEKFRGFNGAIAGKIIKKDPETFEMIVQVDRVIDVWKKNQAKEAKSIEGKQMMLAGFWRRKEQYHSLKVGDRIEAGMQHIGMRSDHLTVAEFVRKAGTRSEAAMRKEKRETVKTKTAGGLPDGANGFMGAVVGRLIEKDVERGTLVLAVDAVPRVWRDNKARRPKELVGKQVEIEGVSSRLLDVLLTTRKGETLEVAGRHDKEGKLTFPGELFRKVAPYKAEDYPVIPEGFQGFQGFVRAQVVKKDPKMYGLIIKVNDVTRTLDRSRAEQPNSIVGKTAILSGFWRRKEQYNKLKVGDMIETGVQHQVRGSDILSVFEGLRKVEKD